MLFVCAAASLLVWLKAYFVVCLLARLSDCLSVWAFAGLLRMLFVRWLFVRCSNLSATVCHNYWNPRCGHSLFR